MKYRFLLFFTAILSISAIDATAAKTRIWDNPTVEINDKALGGFFLPQLEVTRVELGKDKTVISFHAGYRSEFAFDLSPDSYLLVSGEKYPVIGSEGIDYTVGLDTIYSESIDFKLHFPALPKDIEGFDFVSGQNFHIHRITDGSSRRAQVIPSNWRDDRTGDWLIGLFDECVVYDARFWNYVGARPSESTNTFDISDGVQNLQITLGKEKNGKRKIKIGDRNFSCSAITGRMMPPYPAKDMRPFRDTHFVAGDSVEFVGWLKDMPSWARQRSGEYEIATYVYGDEENYHASLDSLGRFSMKFPVDNTCEIYADWGRSFLRNVVEPGQRYFLLYDYKLGQTLFMGPDSRVQNELMIYPPQWRRAQWSDYRGKLFKEMFHDADSINRVLTHELDSVCTRFPTLSDRFRKMHLLNERVNSLGLQLGYAGLTDSVIPYVLSECMPYAGPPYSLSRHFPSFVDGLMGKLNRDWRKTFDWSKYEKEVEYTPEEQVILAKIDSLTAVFQPVYEAMADGEEKEAFRKDHLRRNEALLMQYMQLLNGASTKRVYLPKSFMHEIPHGLSVMDSLGFDQEIKDIWVAYKALEIIDESRMSLSPEVVTYLTENISTPQLLKNVLAENEKYVRLEQRAASSSIPVGDTSTLKGVTEGDKLLEKILEPHRGKIVLIDFWGTWCGPCRESLAHSAELYERLKDYDMVYIYLANNSDENSWRNLIEQYNVKGDNVFHYNLPSDQQVAIERALKISEFPSYRLVDKEGNVLDVNADPRMPGSIEHLLRNL